jgi:magnesium transporter
MWCGSIQKQFKQRQRTASPFTTNGGTWFGGRTASIFRELPREEARELFLNLDARAQARLLLSLSPRAHTLWLRSLAPDDAADLIQQVAESERAGLMAQLDDTTRKEVQALLAYQEDDAGGGRMSLRFARVRPEMNVDDAIAYLCLQATHIETIY